MELDEDLDMVTVGQARDGVEQTRVRPADPHPLGSERDRESEVPFYTRHHLVEAGGPSGVDTPIDVGVVADEPQAARLERMPQSGRRLRLGAGVSGQDLAADHLDSVTGQHGESLAELVRADLARPQLRSQGEGVDAQSMGVHGSRSVSRTRSCSGHSP